MSIRFVAICQWCGKRGPVLCTQGRVPTHTPTIPGKCAGHPSGNPNAPHNPRWVQN